MPAPGQGDTQLSQALQGELADKGFVVAQLDKVVNWARSGSLWGLTFGLACCGVEMIHSWMARYDLDRFGVAPMPSPRSADLMIVAGAILLVSVPATIITSDWRGEARGAKPKRSTS